MMLSDRIFLKLSIFLNQCSLLNLILEFWVYRPIRICVLSSKGHFGYVSFWALKKVHFFMWALEHSNIVQKSRFLYEECSKSTKWKKIHRLRQNALNMIYENLNKLKVFFAKGNNSICSIFKNILTMVSWKRC